MEYTPNGQQKIRLLNTKYYTVLTDNSAQNTMTVLLASGKETVTDEWHKGLLLKHDINKIVLKGSVVILLLGGTMKLTGGIMIWLQITAVVVNRVRYWWVV